MTAAIEPSSRIASLDAVRGVAVMGILAMNIIAFAMPFDAYVNPLAYGASGAADLVSWAAGFIFVDGKMRGLFSFLFGASMLLVIERAEAKGEFGAEVHFRRMIWLLVFGLLHFYLIWFGDILIDYAVVGMIAWCFRKLAPRQLLLCAAFLIVAQIALFATIAEHFAEAATAAAAPHADRGALSRWSDMQTGFGMPSTRRIHDVLALYRSDWPTITRHQVTETTTEPLSSLFLYGWETLGYMLLGMAGLKSGFLTGSWSNASYRRVAVACFALTLPAYAAMAAYLWSRHFAALPVAVVTLVATAPFRPVMVGAYAALIILLARSGGAIAARVAAAGRAAFTNYLGTSILMTFLFYGWGLGLFGRFTRVELWVVVLATWALMLAWSKPWLDRFFYGPLEWVWRSLARGCLQPLRRAAPDEL